MESSIIIPPKGTKDEIESCLDEESKENVNDAVFVMEPTTPLDECGNKKIEIGLRVESKSDKMKSDISESDATVIRTDSMTSSADDDFDRLDDALVAKDEDENVIEEVKCELKAEDINLAVTSDVIIDQSFDTSSKRSCCFSNYTKVFLSSVLLAAGVAFVVTLLKRKVK